ncbi:DUF962 domain-containing protein [Roseomonas sp. HJA6]|uniref:DUF962 domain-containing protein n=1 Tax=Roseomonas alba TaxID=2846776 RepID=A0ABS7A9L7_9PROT|nr:DUF962 domain-containing protein [Neoroseomonas alba]MBW6398988.1 DUF962 domain-containing protein [Neoroseomonas alba]
MAKRIATYAEFWPYYLREHANPVTRAVHAFGTAVAVLLMVAGLLFGPWWLVLLAVVAGYAFAWGSHMLVEQNRPATFTYPTWSLISDFRMAWLMATGRLGPELEKAGVP